MKKKRLGSEERLMRSTLFHIFHIFHTLLLIIFFFTHFSTQTSLFSMATMHVPPATLFAGKPSAVLSLTTQNNSLDRPTNRSSCLVLRSSFLPIFSVRPLPISSSSPRISMRVASKQSYICRDCGYIYNDKKTPFDKLPDNYFCPVCSAPKRRFRPYMPDVSKNVNDKDVRKARKAELQRDEAVGKALPIGIAVGVLALVALYFYVNSTT